MADHIRSIRGEVVRYDVFISYSQFGDLSLAEHLQDSLSRLAKPWWRRRALSVFRDESVLTANPGLWSSIASAIEDSRYFLLLASPEAAASPWVAREVAHWRAHRGTQNMLIALTSGELVWADAAHDFDWARTTALSTALAGMFTEAPRYVDLRWARAETTLDLSDFRFRNQVAEIAAPIHGVPKEELVSADVRMYRRAVRQAFAAGLALIALIVASLATIVCTNHRVHVANGQVAAAQRQSKVLLVHNARFQEKNDQLKSANLRQTRRLARKDKLNHQLSSDLATKSQELGATSGELAATSQALGATDQRLASTSFQLSTKSVVLGTTTDALSAAENQLSDTTTQLAAETDATQDANEQANATRLVAASQGASDRDQALMLAAAATDIVRRTKGAVPASTVRQSLLNALERDPASVENLRGLEGTIADVATSPDSREVAAITTRGQIGVWNLDTRKYAEFPVEAPITPGLLRRGYRVTFGDANAILVHYSGPYIQVYRLYGDGTYGVGTFTEPGGRHMLAVAAARNGRFAFAATREEPGQTSRVCVLDLNEAHDHQISYRCMRDTLAVANWRITNLAWNHAGTRSRRCRKSELRR